jgi:16S rRNA (adenine1518-N6/adenine1519-N6)-dimethyltransferase
LTLPPPTHPSIRLKQLDTHARKRFGQNFLASEGTIAGIVRAAGFQPNTTVLEIGPGLGNLTRALLEAGADLTAVELDRDLAAALSEWFVDVPNLRIIQGDAAKQSWPDLFPLEKRPVICVANLPYNVGTGLLQGLVAAPEVFSDLVVMLQREVADRLLAQPGDRD